MNAIVRCGKCVFWVKQLPGPGLECEVCNLVPKAAECRRDAPRIMAPTGQGLFLHTHENQGCGAGRKVDVL